MNPRAAKQKGNRFEIHLTQVIREQLDPKAYRIVGSGKGIDKNDVRMPSINIEIEAKNANQVSLVKDFEQLEQQNTSGNVGVLAIRNPKKAEFLQTFIVMDLGDWIDLVKRAGNEDGEGIQIENQLDPNLKWKIRNVIQASKALLKEIGDNT